MNTQTDPVVALVEAYQASQSEIDTLKENLNDVRAMMQFEDRGWKLIAGSALNEDLEGLSIEDVQGIAEKISPRVAAGALDKRAVDLHAGFVWGRGCYIQGTEKPKGGGRPSGVRTFFADRGNQEALFSDVAREELQKARFIDGNVLAAVNPKTKKVNRIPFRQIIDMKVDPDFPENVIAYRREWDTHSGNKDSVKRMWYYTARFTGTRKSFFTGGDGKREPIDPDITIVDLRVNRQVGHVLGIPDGLAGMLWAESYGRIIRYGESVQESLAKILFRVTNKTKTGVRDTGVKISEYGGHGGTASMADGQELTAVSTAGKGYDYASARPVAAMAASAWNVSNMDLLNDSSAAGSSYGSAQALVGGNRNAMLLMQKEWAGFYKDIFEIATGERPTVLFAPFEDPDKYREMQALKLGSDALSDEEYRMATLTTLDIVGDASKIPDALKNRWDTKTAAQQASPDQGKANGSNSGGKGANDQRSDTVSKESLRQEMANELYLDRLEGLVARMEAVQFADSIE